MYNVREECHKMQTFESICLLYGRELQRFIFTLTRKDLFATEEIYQNTMLGALKGLGYLKNTEKMKSWIFSIAKAEARRYYAASQVPAHGWGRAEGEENVGVGYETDFTKSIVEKEYVKDLINGLTEEEQQLYVLHYYYDLPLKRISEILCVNYNTLRSMHMRGMVKLRRQM